MNFSGIPKVRCSVNGARQKFVNGGTVKERSVLGDSAKWERDGKPTEYLGFYNYVINMPIQWKASGQSENPDMTSLSGNWECELRDGTETIRTFRWTVGNDGFPVENAEQKSGNINLHWGAYLIETEISTDNSLEESLMAMPNAGLFYGIPMKTEEGKKIAAGIPTKGKPYLMP